MLTLLALGGLAFWITCVVLFFVISALVENESGVWATLVLIGTILGVNYFYKLSLYALATANPWTTATYIGYYLVAGVAWSFIKWYVFLRKQAKAYDQQKQAFLKENNATEMTPSLAYQFSKDLFREFQKPVQASEHKADLVRWASYWPFSLAGTFLRDFALKVWEHIYELFSGVYQRMADAMFKEAHADAALAKTYVESKRK